MNIPTNIMPWACLPASLAMVLDMSFEEVIRELGHSGDEFPYPESKTTRKGFHIQECIDVAMMHGFSVTEILAYFGSRPNPESTEQAPTMPLEEAIKRFHYYIAKCQRGIFSGLVRHPDKSISNHAAAWDGQLIYDPRGLSYEFNDAPRKNFLPQTLWIFTKMEPQYENNFMARMQPIP